MKKLLATALAATLLVTSTASAQGARNCAPRDDVIERLAEGYGETRHVIGLAANNSVMEVYGNNETGTWTVTVTVASGMTCLVASGQSFEMVADALPDTNDPA